MLTVYSAGIRLVKAYLILMLLSITGCSGCQRKAELHPAESTNQQASSSSESKAEGGKGESGDNNGEDISNPVSDENHNAEAPSSTGARAAPSGGTGNSPSTHGDRHGAPDGSTGTGSGDGPSAREAQQRAKNSLDTAKGLASGGDVSRAFQELSSAWQGLQPYLDDPPSRALADELKVAMEEYGESLNNSVTESSQSPTSRKPITVE